MKNCKKLSPFIIFLSLFVLAGGVFAATATWDAEVDNDWFKAENWVGIIPSPTVYGGVDWIASEVYPVMDGSVDPYTCLGFRIAGGSKGPVGAVITLDVNAGNILITDYIKLITRISGQTARLNVNGGSIVVEGNLHIGWTAKGHLQMNGGSLQVESLIMSDNVAAEDATANIHGGQFYADNLIMQNKYHIDIQNNGVFSVPNNDAQFGTIQELLSDGDLTAYNGAGNINLDLSGEDIVITAYPFNADQASGAWPALAEEIHVLYDTSPIQLSWNKGAAATGHVIYLSNDFDLVNNADPAAYQATVPAGTETYAYNGVVTMGDTLYWRVDEQTPSGLVEGPVWFFYVNDAALIENFEDGLASWTAFGSAILSEDPNNNFGDVALKMEFDGAGSASRTLASSINLTAGGIETLALMFHGSSAQTMNAADMYVQLTDGSAYSSKVNYDGQAGDILQADWENWKQWNIALSDFDGTLDLTDIVTITVGFDGGTGAVSFDNIAAYPRRCVSDLAAAADFNDDCDVNILDFAILGSEWLDTAFDVAPEAITELPIVHYTFDEFIGNTVVNSSTYGDDPTVYDGTKTDSAQPMASGGYDGGGCLYLPTNQANRVTVPAIVFDDPNGVTAVSVSMWANLEPASLDQNSALFVGITSARENIFTAETPSTIGYLHVTLNSGDGEIVAEDEAVRGPNAYINTWNHYVFVKDIDNGILRIYMNGEPIAETLGVDYGFDEIVTFTLGASDSGVQKMFGKLDDFRLYQTALTWGQVLELYGATGPLHVMLDSETDIVDDEVVNDLDLAAFGQDWLDDGDFPQ